MKKLVVIILLLSSCASVTAQRLLSRKWDGRFGTSVDDPLNSICATPNGGFLLAGVSYGGIEGDRTIATRGGSDMWVVMIDSDGHYLWDKAYGGNHDDGILSAFYARDGNIWLVGGSESGISGDKSTPWKGNQDIWVVKIDPAGHKLWDKTFGGPLQEVAYIARSTADGGCIIGASADSDSGTDISQNNRDRSLRTGDYWILKLDSNGNKQWDRRFGTIADEGVQDVLPTPDGGYLIGGNTAMADTSFDKTKPRPGIWVIKIDSAGNKEWDNVYYASSHERIYSLFNTPDGNYLIGASSGSGAVGDKTTPNPGYWLVKIDTAGNKLADWSYGNGQQLNSVTSTSDHGYILSGLSGDWIGYGKSEPNLSMVQVWTLKVDSQMRQVWDKTSLNITTVNSDFPTTALEINAHCALVGLSTTASIGGDKSQLNWDTTEQTFDYWVVEYCDTVLTGIMETAGNINFSIYPNPTSHEVSVTLQKNDLKEASFVLTNASGQLIYQSNETNLANTYTKMLDLGTLPAGIYLLDVITDGQKITRKIIKE